jgi:hypothetical protein
VVGGVVAAALALIVALVEVPSSGLLGGTRVGSALAVALLTFALPNFGLPTFGPVQSVARAAAGRVVPALLAAALVYGLDASQLAFYRLRATVASGELVPRAAAVRQLARGGHRSFDREDLSWLDLSGADLTGASFRDTSLLRANLTGAVLVGSSFDGAALSYANLRGANLADTNAESARGWELADCDFDTKLPAGAMCIDGHPGGAAPHPAQEGAGSAPP